MNTELESIDYRDFLKEKALEIKDTFSAYIKGVTMYLVITGGLLKFALDQNATPELRAALSIFGILVSVIGFGTCIFSFRYQKAVVQDMEVVAKGYDNAFSSNLLPFKYMTWLLLAFVSIVICGWLYLLF